MTVVSYVLPFLTSPKFASFQYQMVKTRAKADSRLFGVAATYAVEWVTAKCKLDH